MMGGLHGVQKAAEAEVRRQSYGKKTGTEAVIMG